MRCWKKIKHFSVNVINDVDPEVFIYTLKEPPDRQQQTTMIKNLDLLFPLSSAAFKSPETV